MGKSSFDWFDGIRQNCWLKDITFSSLCQYIPQNILNFFLIFCFSQKNSQFCLDRFPECVYTDGHKKSNFFYDFFHLFFVSSPCDHGRP